MGDSENFKLNSISASRKIFEWDNESCALHFDFFLKPNYYGK